jgi:hypothetical protein
VCVCVCVCGTLVAYLSFLSPPPSSLLKQIALKGMRSAGQETNFTHNTDMFYVLFKFCFTREGTQGSPLVNPLNNVFFKFMMLITS